MRMQWPAGTAGQGVHVNVSSRADLLTDLRSRMEQRRGFSVATLNLDHVVKLSRLPEFAAAYQAHSHVTADGNPIVWLSRLAGQSVDLVPGSELVVPVAELAAQTGTPVALFGSTNEALADAAATLMRQCPGIDIVATLAPPMGFDPTGVQADAYIESMRASGAGLCFVALGAPKQEIFAARAGAMLGHMGFLSIGAGLDFLSARQRRAPRLVRALAAEWLWRMALDPRRLVGRYIACIAILPGLVLRAVRIRRGLV